MCEPIRILQVFAEMNRGGAETMIMNQYRHIDRAKIQFDFMVHTQEKCAFDEEIEHLGGKIYRIPKYVGKNHYAYKKAWINFFINHPEFKIIHGHVRSTAAIYLKVAKKNGLMTIAHSHSTASRGTQMQKVVKNIMQYFIRYNADFKFACSYESGKYLFGKSFDVDHHHKIIKNTIEPGKYKFDIKERRIIRKLLNVENKFVIGHIGSFSEPKNHQFILDVFYEVQKECDSTLLLVGDGTLSSKIKEKAEKLNLNNDIILTGIRTDIPDLLQAIDVFLFPSLFEGLPVTLIEAQASGLKIFASDVITKAVAITDNIEFISLNQSTQYWAEKVLSYKNGYERKNKSKEIIKAGYGVEESAKWLENFYIEQYNIKTSKKVFG